MDGHLDWKCTDGTFECYAQNQFVAKLGQYFKNFVGIIGVYRICWASSLFVKVLI